MSALHEKYESKGLVVLGVNAWDEDHAEVRKFVEDNQLKHRILLDGGEVANHLYHKKGIPTVLWIDKEGVVRETELGFEGPEDLERRTQRLLRRR